MEYEAVDKTHNDLADPGLGVHLWTVLAMFRVSNPEVMFSTDGVVHMDRENLLTIEGPGCFKCEQPWNDRLAQMKCKGSMT